MDIDFVFLLWLLLAGSVFGYVLETLWYRRLRGKWICRKGVIYGPYSPIYGVGMAGFWLLFQQWKKKNLITVFLIASLVGSAFEYFCGFLQEKVFGTKSWDYSKKPFQIKGRICLEFAIYWGLAGVGVNFFALPMLTSLYEKMQRFGIEKLLPIIFLLFLLDCLVSVLACFRQRLRRNGIYHGNALERFFDEHYPDERLDSIFTEIRIVEEDGVCTAQKDALA